MVVEEYLYTVNVNIENRRIYGSICESGMWRMRSITEINHLLDEENLVSMGGSPGDVGEATPGGLENEL